MIPIKKLIHTALSLCLLTGFSSPVAAAGMPVAKSESVPGLNIPVAFNKTLTASRSALSSFGAPVEVEMYQTGTLLSMDLSGNARVLTEQGELHVKSSCLAITQEQKEALAKEQEREIEEQKRVEEAQEKVEEARVQSEQTAARENYTDEVEEETIEIEVETTSAWTGSVLTPSAGVNAGPSGKETYYNLPMEGVVSIMRSIGNQDPYWVREDGVKMLGDYVMVAAHLPTRPRGSLIPTSLGMGIVCDTGTFALNNHTQLDIAVNW